MTVSYCGIPLPYDYLLPWYHLKSLYLIITSYNVYICTPITLYYGIPLPYDYLLPWYHLKSLYLIITSYNVYICTPITLYYGIPLPYDNFITYITLLYLTLYYGISLPYDDFINYNTPLPRKTCIFEIFLHSFSNALRSRIVRPWQWQKSTLILLKILYALAFIFVL